MIELTSRRVFPQEARYNVTVDGAFVGYVYQTDYRGQWRIEGHLGWHPTREAAAEALVAFVLGAEA